MDKKQTKGGRAINTRTVHGTTLREENIGKKHVDVNSMLRMEHLQKLATWTSVEAGIAPLGALFGHRLATCAEAEGVPLDPSTFVCHRCESILQPGFNCTVRIEKNTKKAKRHKKAYVPLQNNVVYKCSFCSHRNLLRGTQRGYVKSLLPSKPMPDASANVQSSSSKAPSNSARGSKDKDKLNQNTVGEIPLTAEASCELKCGDSELDAVAKEVNVEKSPMTPLEMLASSSKRKRKKKASAANKDSTSASSSATLKSVEGSAGTSKRRRKGWSSLKAIANKEAQSSRSLSHFAIPFLLQATK